MTKGALEDKFAFEEFKKLIEKHNVKRIIETGTYKGWSSKVLARFGLPVVTIESDINNFEEAKRNLSSEKNVSVIHGSSPNVLRNVISDNEEGILFFLDAHWGQYWPLLDELKCIAEKKTKPASIIIHDFFVPDENGNAKFGYDKYNGVALDFKYIHSAINEIYGEGEFDYHYTSEIDCVNSGLIYIYKKND